MRELDDGVIYMALDAATVVKKVGGIDAVVNAYRLTGDEATHLDDAKRHIKMGGEGGR